MSVIAHISDLHFPYTRPELLQALLHSLREEHPDLTVVSGDITQRARAKQFIAAARYFETLPRPILMIPGNHDVPLYHLFNRFFRPLKNYRRYISEDLMPVFENDQWFILGVDSTRALTPDLFGFWKNGTLSEQQLEQIIQRFSQAKPRQLKTLVLHHPLVNHQGGLRDTICHRERILPALQTAGVDLILSGHLHQSGNAQPPPAVSVTRRMLCILAGSACSTRLRNETNSYNLLRWNDGELVLSLMRFDGERFYRESETIHRIRQQQDLQ